MKKIIVFLFPIVIAAHLNAQIANGSMAPDFTATDTQGNSWNLYSLLSDGKIVVLNIFGAWDSYAWQYYQSGELHEFYALYGPSGTNQVMVLNIEAESSNGIGQLSGPQLLSGENSTQTQGDWLTDNPMPVIDNAGIADSLQVNYLPTVFMICPDKVVSELSQLSAQLLSAEMNGLSCPFISEGFDPALINGTVFGACGMSEAQISFNIKNVGTELLTNAEIAIEGIETPFTYVWTGNLSSYAQEQIVLDNIVLIPNTDVTLEIITTDVNAANNSLAVSGGFVQTTLHIQIELGLDNWADEVSWEIRDANDSIIYSDGNFTIPYQYFNNTYVLPADGCYSFYLRDTQGDGLHGGQWGGFDGSCYVRGLDSDGNALVTIYSYDGSYDFSSILATPSFEKAEFEALNALTVATKSEKSSLHLFPNPSQGKFWISTEAFDTGRMQLYVFDSYGNVVYAIDRGVLKGGLQSIEIEMEFLESGLYHLRAEDGMHTFTTPVMIIR